MGFCLPGKNPFFFQRRPMKSPPTIHLKPGREKSLLRRHPWVFSGAIQGVSGDPLPGETVDVLDSRGVFLARAACSPSSQIRARVWTWDPAEAVDESFFARRLARALRLRQDLLPVEVTGAYRLVHGESDGLPGLVVDRYSEVLSLQLLSTGAEYWRETIVACLENLLAPAAIYERSDAEVRTLEGLPERCGLLSGSLPGDTVLIQEHGLQFNVDLAAGHKTGFYLDQRQNRIVVEKLARDRRVLDCFCYTGGFSLSALHGGAGRVTGVDTSTDALQAAAAHVALNHLPQERIEWVQADVFHHLRNLRDRGARFDLVILDPPKFAPTAALAQRAARGYKDINLLALKLIAPGGYLVTFSCSGGVSPDLFQKIVAGAALDAGVQASIVQRLSQAPDHPVALNFPEGEYLKGLVLLVD
jgi:23S rRNA (cytosine1962-C5)-methyltransferase